MWKLVAVFQIIVCWTHFLSLIPQVICKICKLLPIIYSKTSSNNCHVYLIWLMIMKPPTYILSFNPFPGDLTKIHNFFLNFPSTVVVLLGLRWFQQLKLVPTARSTREPGVPTTLMRRSLVPLSIKGKKPGILLLVSPNQRSPLDEKQNVFNNPTPSPDILHSTLLEKKHNLDDWESSLTTLWTLIVALQLKNKLKKQRTIGILKWYLSLRENLMCWSLFTSILHCSGSVSVCDNILWQKSVEQVGIRPDVLFEWPFYFWVI